VDCNCMGNLESYEYDYFQLGECGYGGSLVLNTTENLAMAEM